MRRSILDGSPDAYYQIGPDWRFVYFNCNAAEKLRRLGKDPDALIGKVIWHVLPDVPDEAVLRRVMEDRVPVTEELYFAPLGEWHQNHIYPSPDGGIATFQRDITERKRRDKELQRNQAYLAEGQRLTKTGSWGWKIATGEVFWSEEQFHIHGCDPRGPPPSAEAALDLVHPDDRSLIERTLGNMLAEIHDYESDYRIIVTDGTVKYVRTTCHPVFEGGVLAEYVGTTMDVTHQIRADDTLRRTQEALARVTRVMTVGELMASVAHELNQPLAAIVAHGGAGHHWLAREPMAVDEARRAFERVVRDATRAGEILRRIRSLVMQAESVPAAVQLGALVSEALGLLEDQARSSEVTVRPFIEPGLPPVQGDAVQLQQVVINLVTNAMEAMSDADCRPRMLCVDVKRADPVAILVAIRDSGPGFEADREGMIFEPFYTTKSGGLGMGLPISRTIVEAHGGRLWAETDVAGGATFQFTLPI
jgi:signal transduction histidine kinase